MSSSTADAHPPSSSSSSQRRTGSFSGFRPRRLSSSTDRSARPADLESVTGRGVDIPTTSRSLTPTGQREPIRSFVHLSYRGQPPASVDNTIYSRSIREDTAELANYALSETGSAAGDSPNPRRSSMSYFPDPQAEHNEQWRRTPIPEVSEPTSPINGQPPHRRSISSGIGDMLKAFPVQQEESDGKVSLKGGEGAALDRPTYASHNVSAGDDQASTEVASEATPLLSKHAYHSPQPESLADDDDVEGHSKYQEEPKTLISLAKARTFSFAKTVVTPKRWNRDALWRNCVAEPLRFLPTAVLGTSLNILDSLSFGMILWPLSEPTFAKLGSAGISIFYVSTIVSQLTFSCGMSIFKGAFGSEMVEIIPFIHSIAYQVLAKVGDDKPDVVLATAILAMSLSAILTGIVFYTMGRCHFGYIVGFIPRHILIGGVGFFMLITGLEVTARMENNLEFTLETLNILFKPKTIPLWAIPMALALNVCITQRYVSSKYYLSGYILTIPLIFYFFVLSIDQLEPANLRKTGWIFEGPEAGEPWWYFYTLFNFKLVDWEALLSTVPAMFALTFFGILHVPINVPALAFSIGEDNVDLDRELLAHGVSNVLSGCLGSVQNYLVYSNSVLFYKTGADGRLAGFMLAILTTGTMIIGPSIISYVPVMMVGTLIFILGFELTYEALVEPRHKLKTPEYLTVVAIVLIMGIYDFVAGIFIGIGLAFVSMVLQTARVSAVRADYTGETAGSTVRRNPAQARYLRDVGQQIHITKLAGYLFFGTIVNVEERIRSLIDDESFHERPIRFLVFDFYHVTGIDYSAAEAFNRLNRVFSRKGVTTRMSSVDPDGPLGKSLMAVGLGSEGNPVSLYADLNSALESCENDLLKTLYHSKEVRAVASQKSPASEVNIRDRLKAPPHIFDPQVASPRNSHLHRSAVKALDAHPDVSAGSNLKEPLRLILQTFQGLTMQNEDFWFRAVPFFTRRAYAAGTPLFARGSDASEFYLVESGVLRAEHLLPQGRYAESIVAGTTCGELPFFGADVRRAAVVVEHDAVLWALDRRRWRALEDQHPDLARELMRVALKLTAERMQSVTGYVLTTAG